MPVAHAAGLPGHPAQQQNGNGAHAVAESGSEEEAAELMDEELAAKLAAAQQANILFLSLNHAC